MSDNVDRMRHAVTEALARLEPWFKHHRLTFVARNTLPGTDSDIIISNDDHPAVAAVLLEHERRAHEENAR